MRRQSVREAKFHGLTDRTEQALTNMVLTLLICLPLIGGYIILGEFYVQNSMSLANDERLEVMVHFSAHGHWPIDASGWRESDSDALVQTAHGAITVKLSGTAPWGLANRQLTLRPATVTGHYPSTVSWVCGDVSRWPHFVAQGEDKTNLHSQFFGFSCP